MSFSLDPRLEADSALITELSLSQARLMNDARFPWVLLIPQRPNMTEIVDLPPNDQAVLLTEINAVSAAMRVITWLGGPIQKLNTAALGNLVPQLHIHIIGRRCDDAAWPGPVWGVGDAKPYDDDTRAAQIGELRDHLREPPSNV